ncbi:MAG: trehalase family glycosidase [Gammaproteobacteria bacterium]|nr:trehalase family glycosidase [Gammaproteobacteria bacterium]
MKRFQQYKNSIFIFTVSLFFVYSNSYAKSINTKPIEPDILQYIHNSWHDLTRTATNCGTYQDSKVANSPILYLPYHYPITPEILKLKNTCHINVANLPRAIKHIGDIKTNELESAGLLYLPYPYVVPGGRFNEMYGWDSYFIILGLLHDGETQLANNMLENYFFEIEHYGTILNANRTYHLSRSQPPFLSSTILAVYHTQQIHDQAWLQRAYHYAKKDYNQWVTAPFLAGNTHLSRYYDVEQSPLVEEKAYSSYYDKILLYIKKHPRLSSFYVNPKHKNMLSNDFYQGERSLRASGFDITARFGTFGEKTHYYAPVCLNSLLYKTEKDLALIAMLLHKNSEAQAWEKKATQRKKAMVKYLWNKKSGLFLDYDFVNKKQSSYHYATTFYPLWAGLASEEQASALEKNLSLFEQPGGLAVSDRESGVQWDKPFGWAPIELLAVQGLSQYGYKEDAHRIAEKFYLTIKKDFSNNHKIFEKYNVVDKSSAFTTSLGYEENVIGFGWTNSTYLIFDDLLKAPIA